MELIIVECKSNVQGGNAAETDKGTGYKNLKGEFTTKSTRCIV